VCAATAVGGDDPHAALVADLCSFLEADLQHLFDDTGIDVSRYEASMQFEDPLTLHTSLEGYLFNIQFLRRVFNPTFVLHGIKRTGPLQVTTRWTMDMRLAGMSAAGAPLLTFTGVSVLDVDPISRKLCRHVDMWDSVQNNRYLSLEAVGDLVGQLLSGAPPSSGPFVTLLRRKDYHVRRYITNGQEAFAAVAWFKKDARGGAAAAAQLRAALQRDGVPIAAGIGGGGATFREDSSAGGLVEVHIPLAEGFQLPWTV
jgi:hypothetical protein